MKLKPLTSFVTKKVNIIQKTFTLVELLVVIAILAVLLTLSVPVLKKTLYKSTNLSCVTNLKNLTLGTLIYCDDYNDFYPMREANGYSSARFGARLHNLPNILSPYVDNGEKGRTWVCPLYEYNKHENITWNANGANRNGTLGICSEGGRRGCQIHGLKHASKLRSDWRRFEANPEGTYGFLGGLIEYTTSLNIYAKNDRLRFGDLYKINGPGSNRIETGLLWAHSGLHLGVPGTTWGGPTHNKFGTTHAPPPGTDYYHDDNYIHIVNGLIEENFAFDDGSVFTGSFYFNNYWFNPESPYVSVQDMNTRFLFPRER